MFGFLKRVFGIFLPRRWTRNVEVVASSSETALQDQAAGLSLGDIPNICEPSEEILQASTKSQPSQRIEPIVKKKFLYKRKQRSTKAKKQNLHKTRRDHRKYRRNFYRNFRANWHASWLDQNPPLAFHQCGESNVAFPIHRSCHGCSMPHMSRHHFNCFRPCSFHHCSQSLSTNCCQRNPDSSLHKILHGSFVKAKNRSYRNLKDSKSFQLFREEMNKVELTAPAGDQIKKVFVRKLQNKPEDVKYFACHTKSQRGDFVINESPREDEVFQLEDSQSTTSSELCVIQKTSSSLPFLQRRAKQTNLRTFKSCTDSRKGDNRSQKPQEPCNILISLAPASNQTINQNEELRCNSEMSGPWILEDVQLMESNGIQQENQIETENNSQENSPSNRSFTSYFSKIHSNQNQETPLRPENHFQSFSQVQENQFEENAEQQPCCSKTARKEPYNNYLNEVLKKHFDNQFSCPENSPTLEIDILSMRKQQSDTALNGNQARKLLKKPASRIPKSK